MTVVCRLLLVFCLWVPATGAVAQSGAAPAATQAAAQIDEAAEALEAAYRSRDRIAALTETIRAYENGLVALRDSMRQAAIQESAILTVLAAKEEQLIQLLGVLQTIEHAPLQLLMLHPAGPIGAARSGMMLSDVTPGLKASADDLAADLEELRLLRALQESAAATLQEGLTGVQEARLALSQALSERTDRPQRMAENPEQMQALVEASETLQAFATGLSTLPDAQTTAEQPDIDTAKGGLALPVRGTLLRAFNDSDAAGISRPGWILATRPLSIVTNPWAATVRYAGPLLDYGNVVILEPGQNTLIIIAGMQTLYVAQGDVVAGGEPLGLMGRPGGADENVTGENLIDSGADRTETLYIEFRENRTPVDPAEWFASQEE